MKTLSLTVFFVFFPTSTSLSHCFPHYFCILSHFKLLRCTVKSLITTLTYFLLKYNWKKKTSKVFFRRQSLSTQKIIPVSQTARIRHCTQSITYVPSGISYFLFIYDLFKYLFHESKK